MPTLQQAAMDFLAQRRIAVAGVSRHPQEAANVIFRKLKNGEREVYAVNPHAERVEGERAYPTLAAIPGGVDAVVIATPPKAAEAIVRECAELGIGKVWMHRSLGTGSVCERAVELCHEQGIEVIAGGCPMMFAEPVDLAHRCLRGWLKLTGKLPRPESRSEADLAA